MAFGTYEQLQLLNIPLLVQPSTVYMLVEENKPHLSEEKKYNLLKPTPLLYVALFRKLYLMNECEVNITTLSIPWSHVSWVLNNWSIIFI